MKLRSLITNEIDNGGDQNVKYYAGKYLPHVNRTSMEAEEILGLLED